MNVYKTIFPNGKIYIGQDSRDRINYFGSGKLARRAIKKYGKENLKKEILIETDNKIALDLFETYFQNKNSICFYPLGYNICHGPWGGDNISNHPNNKDIRMKMSKAKIGKKRIFTEEHLKNMRNPKSENTKMKMKGRTPWNKNKKMSEDYINKRRKAQKELWLNPEYRALILNSKKKS